MAVASSPTATEYHYHPQGGAVDLLRCQSPEVIISGPAGTGKSLACLWKLHFCASNVPGFRCLILRKTRESITDSALVTFERDVLPDGHPSKTGQGRQGRRSYRYPNGAEIVIGGLRQAGRDMTQKVMSTDYDMIYVQEAIELEEEEWEKATTRLRNGKLPYQQIIADTNPAQPTHWLKRRCDAGKCVLHESRHEDNPRLWDGADWTPEGTAYLAKLDALTGARLQRLRFGRWVQAEGVVYEGWDPSIHLVDPFEIPIHWPRVLSVDFGFTNPFVCQWWAVDDDDRLFMYREIYSTQRLVEDHARDIVRLHGREPEPTAVICDHDAEDRATLERHTGWATSPAVKWKRPGFDAVASRLRRAGDGKPRLFIFKDALAYRDALLDEAKKPCCTSEEWDGYVWHDTKQDEPVKENDHGMDAVRYLCASLDEGIDDGEEEAGRSLRA